MYKLGSEIARWSGAAPGLPQLRLALVLAVIVFQSAEVSESWIAVMSTPLWIVQALALPALFAATGYVLALSRRRTTRRALVVRRIRRVLPTVVMAIVGSIAIAGPLATNLSLGSYLQDPETWTYLANLIAVPVYALPGVFEFNNVATVVNTMVAVFPLYAVLVGTAALLPDDDRRMSIIVGALLVSTASAAIAAQALDIVPSDSLNMIRYVLAGPGLGILLSGWFGILIYSLRGRVFLSIGRAAAVAGFLALVALGGHAGWAASPLFWIISTPAVAYLVIYLSMQRLGLARLAALAQPLLFPALLFAYPMQQTAAALGPRNQSLIENFGIVAIPLGLAAALSWYLVARHIGGKGADMTMQLLIVPPDEPVRRARRSLRARLQSLLVPIALSIAVGFVSILLMAMLFLALSRGN